eukprot:1159897-Pelagomonas_calceolata.AAC.5
MRKERRPFREGIVFLYACTPECLYMLRLLVAHDGHECKVHTCELPASESRLWAGKASPLLIGPVAVDNFTLVCAGWRQTPACISIQ